MLHTRVVSNLLRLITRSVKQQQQTMRGAIIQVCEGGAKFALYYRSGGCGGTERVSGAYRCVRVDYCRRVITRSLSQSVCWRAPIAPMTFA